MPELNEYEACRQCTSDPSVAAIPAIFLDSEENILADKFGTVLFLAKPPELRKQIFAIGSP